MLNVNIVCVGGLKDNYFYEAAAEYEKRLKKYCKLNTFELKNDSQIINQINMKSYKIALCVEGIQLSSEKLAEKFKGIMNNYSEITLIIGGAEGLSEEVKSLCDYRLSFSAMTFPHRLIRIMLLEQVYRAFTIINNEKYHK